MKTFAIMVLLAVSSPALSQEWSAEACVSALTQAYPSFSARRDAGTVGDFNSDGRLDFALLLDRLGGSRQAAIGVCLSREPRPLLITAPYQTGRIFTKPKGTAYMDYETEGNGVYERDVIAVSDGASAGASYVLRAGVFVRVIDGD